MPVHSTSYQFSAAYGTSAVWRKGPAPESSPVRPEDVENAKPQQLPLEMSDSRDSWQRLFGLTETTTVNPDGTVTQTLSGGVNFMTAHKDGCTLSGRSGFQVSATFDAATYEAGQLTSTASLMAAAYTLSRASFLEAASCMRVSNYHELKEHAAQSFADMVGTPLEERGHAGEWDKIYKSVHAVFASFEAKYEAVTASVSKDSWLDADLWTAAVKLQKIGMSFQMESGRTRGLYSLRELEYAAIGIRSAGMNLRA